MTSEYYRANERTSAEKKANDKSKWADDDDDDDENCASLKPTYSLLAIHTWLSLSTLLFQPSGWSNQSTMTFASILNNIFLFCCVSNHFEFTSTDQSNTHASEREELKYLLCCFVCCQKVATGNFITHENLMTHTTFADGTNKKLSNGKWTTHSFCFFLLGR